MLSTSARLLRLASLLQSRRHWPGGELADTLGVEARTLRRDIGRLRELGYPVGASSGVGGGYALGRGATLPPLLLDDDEAVALVLALRTAGDFVGGIEATALQLLGKLDALMPTRLRRRSTALHAVTLSLRGGPPLVQQERLQALAMACRDSQQLVFRYRDHGGRASRRQVEPARLANYGRRWYLVGWDVGRGDWRTFRVDRIDGEPEAGPVVPARAVPDDVARRLERGIAYAPFQHRLTLRLEGSPEALRKVIPPWCGLLEPESPTHCLLRVGADSPEALASLVLLLDRPFSVVEGGEQLPAIRALLQRLQARFSAKPRARRQA